MKKRRITIVDDQIDLLQATVLRLKQNMRDIEILEFSDPNEAYRSIVENNGNDLLLIDCFMPEMSGLELYNSLRQAGVRTPVCFFSTDEDELRKMEHIPGVNTWLKQSEGRLVKEFCDKALAIMTEYRNMRDIESLHDKVDKLVISIEGLCSEVGTIKANCVKCTPSNVSDIDAKLFGEVGSTVSKLSASKFLPIAGKVAGVLISTAVAVGGWIVAFAK